MNPILLGLTALSFEAFRAEGKVISAVESPPPYTLMGGVKVSVVVPAYNEESYLPMLLSALNNQTYQNIETVVVDNDSTDRTREVARVYGANVISNHDFNLSKSRNLGAEASTGKLLAFFDADTIPQHDLIEKFVNETELGKVLVESNRCSQDSHLHSMFRVLSGWLPGDTVRMAFNGMFIGITRDAFDSVGGFDEALMPVDGEDVDFINRVVSEYPDRIGYLRTTYCATSARRAKVEGISLNPNKPHWGARAIRGY